MTARKPKPLQRDWAAWVAIGITVAGIVWRMATHDTHVDDTLAWQTKILPPLRKTVDSLAKVNDALKDVMTIEHPETMLKYQELFR